jgi:hypothetical protein
MHPWKYTSFSAVCSALIFLTQGCASVRGGVAVEVCVIPPPYVNSKGDLTVDGAECTFASGLDGGTRPFILMPRWVCHSEEDYFRVLGSRR